MSSPSRSDRAAVRQEDSGRVVNAAIAGLIGAAIGTLGLIVGLSYSHFAYDDAWITYRYAYNFAVGEGLVYNLGVRQLGTTSPAYAMVLGALGAVWSPDAIPRLSGLLCAVSLAALTVGFHQLGRATRDELAGVAIGLFVAANPIVADALGGEMVPQAGLIVWALVAQAKGRPMLAGCLAACATILRSDGVLALGLVMAAEAVRRRRIPWREGIAAGLLIGAWLLGLWWYYGSPLPATLAAKHAQRASGIWRPFGFDLFEWLKSYTIWGSPFFGLRAAPGFTAEIGLAMVGALGLLWHRRWALFLVWPVCYLLAYRQLHLPFYHWYAVPLILALLVLAGVGLVSIIEAGSWTARRLLRGAEPPFTRVGSSLTLKSAVVLGLIALPILLPQARYTRQAGGLRPGPAEQDYRVVATWLRENTAPTASVGYLEIGILGYYSRRTIVDALGLVTAGGDQYVMKRDFLGVYRQHLPDYIIHNPVFFPTLLGGMEREDWFRQAYVPVRDFKDLSMY